MFTLGTQQLCELASLGEYCPWNLGPKNRGEADDDENRPAALFGDLGDNIGEAGDFGDI
jgi:hypothetical protein